MTKIIESFRTRLEKALSESGVQIIETDAHKKDATQTPQKR